MRNNVARRSASGLQAAVTTRVPGSPRSVIGIVAGSNDAERRASAPLKAIEQQGVSPCQGNVTALNPTVVTAFP